MRVLLLGSTGAVGSQILPLLLAQGHTVTVAVRSPDSYSAPSSEVKVIKADAHDAPSMDAAVRGQDAVVSALGPRPSVAALLWDYFQLKTIKALLPALERHGVKRFVYLSGLGAGDSLNCLPLPLWLLSISLLAGYVKDRTEAEALIHKSDLAYVIVRAGLLTNGPGGQYGPLGGVMVSTGFMPTRRADLAEFMARQLTEDDFVNKKGVIPTYTSA